MVLPIPLTLLLMVWSLRIEESLYCTLWSCNNWLEQTTRHLACVLDIYREDQPRKDSSSSSHQEADNPSINNIDYGIDVSLRQVPYSPRDSNFADPVNRRRSHSRQLAATDSSRLGIPARGAEPTRASRKAPKECNRRDGNSHEWVQPAFTRD